MKICITSTGPKLDSPIDARFGRCAYFLIVDEEGKLIKAVRNTGVQAMRGAGISAAQIVANEGVNVVITSNIGPNAFSVLGSSGIKVILAGSGTTIKETLKMYKEGKLKEASQATGPAFRGMGGGFGRGGGRGGRGSF